jgi:acyl-CoA thioesterase I
MANQRIELCASMLGFVGEAEKYCMQCPEEFSLGAGVKIVAIGDSITEAGGYLKDVDAVLAAGFSERRVPPIVNVGISGQKAEDLVARFEKDVIGAKPGVVTICVGINDVWHRSAEEHDPKVLMNYWKNVDAMVGMAQSAGIKVLLLTPTVIQENPHSSENGRLEIYVAAEKQIARARRCALVDLHQMFLDALEKRGARQGNWLTNDGVHMEPTGDAIMAIGVLRGLGVGDEMIAGR